MAERPRFSTISPVWPVAPYPRWPACVKKIEAMARARIDEAIRAAGPRAARGIRRDGGNRRQRAGRPGGRRGAIVALQRLAVMEVRVVDWRAPKHTEWGLRRGATPL